MRGGRERRADVEDRSALEKLEERRQVWCIMNRLSIEDVAAFPKPGTRIPAMWQFSDDGQTLYYLFAPEGTNRALWAYEVTSNTHRLVAEAPDHADADTFDEEMRRQRLRRRWDGIAAYQVQGDTVLVPQRGRLYISRKGGPLTPMSDVQDVVDPWLSSDGRYVFGVVGGNLCRIAAEDGTLEWLTVGAEEGLTYGLAEYIAQEELDRSQGYWISPDGAWAVLAEVDERHLPVYSIVHQEARDVWLEPHRYPFVGQDNAKVRLGIRSLNDGGDGAIRWIDWDGTHRYLLDVLWAPGGEFLVLSTSRSQQHLAWDRYGSDGRSLARIYEESSPEWINRPQKSYVSEDNLLITCSERGGHRKLLLVTPDHGWTLIPGEPVSWDVLDILAVDSHRHRAYVSATRNRALERILMEIDWMTGKIVDLTPEPGDHQVVVARDGHAWIDGYSSREKAPETRYVVGGGVFRIIVPSATSPDDLKLIPPEFFTLAAEDGTELNGLVYCPDGDAPAGGWPLVVAVYGGPHAQVVVDDWLETVDLEAQYLAQRGFLVMKLDNRGSANRGHAFERPLFRHFGDVELTDQIMGLRHVAQHWPANLSRVGIYGWSYGGYMTLRALLMAPEIFRVGVAGAPVTDFRWYDTAYTERYLGTDDDNHQGYESTSLVNKAGRLQGKLLLIHGMVDENVHFRHSAAIIDAFVQAGKDFDLVVLPDSRHMISNPATKLYQERHLLQYFEENL